MHLGDCFTILPKEVNSVIIAKFPSDADLLLVNNI